MNKLISILMLTIAIVTGLASFHQFRAFNYDISNLLTITAYLSMVASIYALTARSLKPVKL